MKFKDYSHTEMINGHPCTYNKLSKNELAVCDSDLLSDKSPETQKIILNWVKENLHPRKTPLLLPTSYSLKDILNSETGIYLTNNAFKDAMLQCGFEPKNWEEPYWRFGISKKSPAFTKNRQPRQSRRRRR